MNPAHTALSGAVDITMLLPILNSAMIEARRTRGFRLQLDCAAVEDFTSQALAEISQARRAMRQHGADLMLMQCSGWIRSRMIHPMFEELCV